MSGLRGDELMNALVPTAADLVVAVHDLDDEQVAKVFAEAERLAGDPLAAARHLAVLVAAMVSEDETVIASLGWTLNPTRYHELRSSMGAITASRRAGRAPMTEGDAA